MASFNLMPSWRMQEPTTGAAQSAIADSRRTRAWRRIRALLLPVLFLVPLPALGQAQAVTPEAAMKAAFVYNFTKFTDWPAGTFAKGVTSLSICILGKDGMGDAWNALEGKSAQGKTISVRRLDKMEDARFCQVVYVGTDARPWTETSKFLSSFNALTVSDTDAFARTGGMIELVSAGNKIQFDINLDVTQRANLKISSQVLKLARAVIGERK